MPPVQRALLALAIPLAGLAAGLAGGGADGALSRPLAAAAEETCPPAPDHAAAIDGLLRDLAVAPDPQAAGRVTAALWALWSEAPDDRSQHMLDVGVTLIAHRELSGARRALGSLVSYCPGFAEGWNQRAFAAFLQGDFEAALADLDRALSLRPRHVGALSGRGLTLIALGRREEGEAALREALRLNPWLPERRLVDDPPRPQVDL